MLSHFFSKRAQNVDEDIWYILYDSDSKLVFYVYAGFIYLFKNDVYVSLRLQTSIYFIRDIYYE